MRVRDGNERRLSHVALVTATAVAVIGAALLVWRAVEVLFLLFAGLLVAQALLAMSEPLARRTRLPHAAAVFLVLAVLLGAAVAFGAFFAPAVSRQVDDFVKAVPDVVATAREVLQRNEWGRALLAEAPSPGDLPSDPIALVPKVTGAFATTFGVAADALIVLLAGVWLAFAPHLYARGALSMIPPRTRPRAAALLDELQRTLRWWLVGRLVSMAFVAVAMSIGLSLIGVPLAIPLGILAGLFTFVPYLGFIVAGIPIVLFTLANDPGDIPWAVALYLGVNAVEGSFIEPVVEHRTVHVAPVLGIFMQIVLALVAGAVGTLVAAPLTAVLVVMVKRLHVDRMEDEARLPTRAPAAQEPDDALAPWRAPQPAT